MFNRGMTPLAGANESNAQAILRVDVIADLVCPWCYLGKRRLDEALAAVRGPSSVRWHPFQLNPDMPGTGMAFEEYLARKFGDPVALQPALAELTAAGMQEGIRFCFDKLERVPNTLNAHRVMQLAEAVGGDTLALADDLLRGFFEQGLDIGDRDVLGELAAPYGVTPAQLHGTLDDERSRRRLLSEEAELRFNGVTGVPDFLVNKRLFVVGAHSTDSLLWVFDRAMFGAESDLPVSATVH